jgi:hypothetical protein
MQIFYEEYLNLLQTCHNEIRDALKGLPLVMPSMSTLPCGITLEDMRSPKGKPILFR